MKAVRIHSFGGPEVLKIEEVDTPTPTSDSLLLRIAAASINPVDYKIREGAFPKIKQDDLPITLGRDVCGIVQGSDTGFSAREVIALLDWDTGGYAEYVAVPKNLCVAKPKTASLVDAASIQLAAMTAWQGLFQYGGLKAGQRVLIHAGSGGVGHFAVQFAAARGAQVVSTASEDNLEFVRQLGATTVIDYKMQRFERETSDIDVVFDLVGGDTRERSWQTLRQGGILVSTLGQPDEAQAAKHQVRAKGYMTSPDASQLAQIVALIDEGKVHPVVAKTYRLEEAAAAQQFVEQQHPRGKTVLSVWDGR